LVDGNRGRFGGTVGVGYNYVYGSGFAGLEFVCGLESSKSGTGSRGDRLKSGSATPGMFVRLGNFVDAFGGFVYCKGGFCLHRLTSEYINGSVKANMWAPALAVGFEKPFGCFSCRFEILHHIKTEKTTDLRYSNAVVFPVPGTLSVAERLTLKHSGTSIVFAVVKHVHN
jgi:hypothetical protein